jgi:hypothetical protein
MVTVDIGDEDQVSVRESGEVGRLGGVKINGLASCLDEKASMVERSDLDRARRGLENLCRTSRLSLGVNKHRRKHNQNRQKTEQENFEREFHFGLLAYFVDRKQSPS